MSESLKPPVSKIGFARISLDKFRPDTAEIDRLLGNPGAAGSKSDAAPGTTRPRNGTTGLGYPGSSV